MNQPEGVPDTGQWLLAARPTKQEAQVDRVRPNIRVEGALVTSVFDKSYYLYANISDRGGLASIRLNDNDLLPASDRGTLLYSFSRPLRLEEGTNLFTLTATDIDGNTATRRLVLARRDPEYLDSKYRLLMTAVPMSTSLPEHLAQQVYNLIGHELTKEPIRFNVWERMDDWRVFLEENQLTLDDIRLRPPSRFSKRVPSELYLMGSLLTQGAGRTIYVNIVEGESGNVLFVEDVYSEGLERDLEYQVSGLVHKIERRFPLLHGRVLKSSARKCTLNTGADKGLVTGTRMVVLEPNENASLRASRVRESGEGFMEMKVVHTKRDRSTVRYVRRIEGEEVREGDFLFSR